MITAGRKDAQIRIGEMISTAGGTAPPSKKDWHCYLKQEREKRGSFFSDIFTEAKGSWEMEAEAQAHFYVGEMEKEMAGYFTHSNAFGQAESHMLPYMKISEILKE